MTGPRRSWFQKLGNISETALHDFVDITVFLILGAVLAALSRLFLSHDQMQRLALNYPGVAILIFMGLAILLCICSEADAFIAASFRAVPATPKLAFLVLGPMLDLKLYMMYTPRLPAPVDLDDYLLRGRAGARVFAPGPFPVEQLRSFVDRVRRPLDERSCRSGSEERLPVGSPLMASMSGGDRFMGHAHAHDRTPTTSSRSGPSPRVRGSES